MFKGYVRKLLPILALLKKGKNYYSLLKKKDKLITYLVLSKPA